MTIRDNDGVVHRAMGTLMTLCPWWLTHNVFGEAISFDAHPTCLECTYIEIKKFLGEAPYEPT